MFSTSTSATRTEKEQIDVRNEVKHEQPRNTRQTTWKESQDREPLSAEKEASARARPKEAQRDMVDERLPKWGGPADRWVLTKHAEISHSPWTFEDREVTGKPSTRELLKSLEGITLVTSFSFISRT